MNTMYPAPRQAISTSNLPPTDLGPVNPNQSPFRMGRTADSRKSWNEPMAD